MILCGSATARGTKGFAARCRGAAPGHFRKALHLTVSSIGLGTFPGPDDEDTDTAYGAAIELAVAMGCNVIDTSVAYRNQRSERVVGKTLARLIDAGELEREAIVIASKAGFIPFDSAYSGSVEQYFEETFLRTGLVAPADVISPGHCLAPAFLRHQIETSRSNLGCRTIDIYCLHNPETQLRQVGRQEFHDRLRSAFEVLEHAVADGWIGCYGSSSWKGFSASPDDGDYLSLHDLVHLATEVGGRDHHFRVAIVPFNLVMPEAFTLSNQRGNGGSSGPNDIPLLQAAEEFGLAVIAGASLHQARLARELPPEIRILLGVGLETDAQRALQFARSAPGLATALAGMSSPTHVEENLALAGVPPLSADRFDSLFDP